MVITVVTLAFVLTFFLLYHHEFFAFVWFFLSASADKGLRRHKQALLQDLRGVVVEIGPGRGSNLKYYCPDLVRKLILIEPNPMLHSAIRSEAQKQGLTVEIYSTSAEHIDLPANSVDHVVSTLVLCSVPYENEALREIFRILVLGGTLAFIEHVGDTPGSLRRARTFRSCLHP